jgi:hypothetical protein
MIALAALPDGAIPLAVGTALALAALSAVLLPLLGGGKPEDGANTPGARRREGNAVPDHAEIPADSAVVALREIEFDRETGKLSDSDYADLKARYTQLALDEMRAAATKEHVGRSTPESMPVVADHHAAAPVVVFDPVEAAIQRARDAQRTCDGCGPRPEPDAVYCSDCGRYLDGSCGGCGAPVEVAGSQFCTNCGERLLVA